jgi:predicted CopG family antitoxin
VYKNFQKLARRSNRSTSDLIREAMEKYQQSLEGKRTPLWQAEEPASVGKIQVPWSGRSGLLEDFWPRS